LRHNLGRRSPRLARAGVRSVVAALLAAVAVGMTGCSGETGVAVAPSAAATGAGAPASTPVLKPRPTPTSRVVAPHVVAPLVGAALARSVPVRLQIVAIGVDTTLMDLGLRAGKMEVPPSGFPAGWYTGAPTPGQIGPAIIAGHVDWKGPGVFYNLHKLLPGDEITVTRKDGSAPVFRVTRVEKFPKNNFPTKLVYGNIDHAGLRLITCGGSFNAASGHYEDNIIAFADLVAPTR
jgi:hypothetical protein